MGLIMLVSCHRPCLACMHSAITATYLCIDTTSHSYILVCFCALVILTLFILP